MSEVYDLSGRVIAKKPESALEFEICPDCGDCEWLVVVNKKDMLERLICADDECDGYIELKHVKE